jgi:putative peptide zinc metalloprotease protein
MLNGASAGGDGPLGALTSEPPPDDASTSGRRAPSAPWPVLREELQLHPAGDNRDGSPAWHVADPVRNQFFRIGWLEFEMLQRWALADPGAIARDIRASTTLAPEPEDVMQFAAFLRAQNLVRGPAMPPRTGGGLSDWRWWLHHYLFVRIPLIRPQRMLRRMAPMLGVFYSRWFLIATLLAGVTGIALAARQWDTVGAQLLRVFTFEGTLGFLGALAVSKLIHEFAHAVTATRLGVRVAHMGVALVVMWPMAYTDTGESWKLADPRKRLAIASAGILAELALAAWCTLWWAFLPDGALRSAVFFLATTAWVWTLAINASPFMRFDGYFILCDGIDFPGLHERAGRWGKRWLRRIVPGLDEPAPEILEPGLRRFLTGFALATWVYRLVVFLGIALVVYHAFFKALGIFLFVVEIMVFIVNPIRRELGVWWTRRAAITWRRRIAVAFLLALGVTALLIPWPTRVDGVGVLRVGGEQAIYAPFPAQLQSMAVAQGQAVTPGQPIAELAAPRQAQARDQAAALAAGYGRSARSGLGADQDSAAREIIAEGQRARYAAESRAYAAELARLKLSAPSSGQVVDVDPLLAQGSWVNAATPLAWVVQPGVWQADVLVAESDRARIAVGGRATVVVQGRTQVLQGRIVAIDDVRVQRLPHLLLAANHGGPLPVVPGTGKADLQPTESLYRVAVQGDGDMGRPAVRRVRAHLEADQESLGWRWLAAGVSALIQQAGW